MEFRPLSEWSLQETAALWNEGFRGYFVDLAMTMDQFLRRVAADQLSLERSFALVKDGQPIGFVLNGFRRIGGKRVAWNGGTAVIPEYRSQGIGKLLMNEAIALYKREGVESAWLEAIKANTAAISLYQRSGYEIVDHLTFYHQAGALPPNAFSNDEQQVYKYRLVPGVPQDVEHIRFYAHDLPWQSQCSAIQNGQALIALDEEGQEVGYALFKRIFDEQGVHKTTCLYQCVIDERVEHRNALMCRLLREVYGSDDTINRRTMNWSSAHQEAELLLRQAGFQQQTEQVHMKLVL